MDQSNIKSVYESPSISGEALSRPPRNGTLLEVRIPDDVVPGETALTIKYPNECGAGEQSADESHKERYFKFTVPDSCAPGDVVRVMVGVESVDANCESNEGSQDRIVASRSSYLTPRTAALTAGGAITIIGTLIVGPLVTGVVVVGVLGYVSHREAKRLEAEAITLRREREDCTISEQELCSDDKARYVLFLLPTENVVDPNAADDLNNCDRSTQELRLSESIRNATNQICTAVSDFDDKCGISTFTMKAITTAQQMDERNHVSEKLASSVQQLDEKLHVSAAVSAGYESSRALDEQYHISDSISSSSTQFVDCMQHVNMQYQITTRVTSAATTAAAFIGERIQQWTAGNSNQTAIEDSSENSSESILAAQQEITATDTISTTITTTTAADMNKPTRVVTAAVTVVPAAVMMTASSDDDAVVISNAVKV